MNGQGSKLELRFQAIHAARNTTAQITKIHDPMPVRMRSAARSPKVSAPS